MNFGSVLIILLGGTTLLWFVWLGYSDHRRLRQLFGGNVGRSKPTPVDDAASPAAADEPRTRA